LQGQEDLLLINQGNDRWRFSDETSFAGHNRGNSGRGLAAADLDGDGDVDFVVNNFQGNAEVWINETRRRGNWVKFCLQGPKGNGHGIGSTVVLQTAGGRQAQAMTCGHSYLSDNPKTLHFGVGGSSRVKSVEVHWSDGHFNTFTDLPVNRLHVLAYAREP
jgi:hypothetical protein